MKKAVLFFILALFILGAYLYLTNFSLVKKLVGYNLPSATTNPSGSLNFLSIPEGFNISIAAKDLEDPRVILFDSKGRMLVSETKAGRVSILENQDKNDNFKNKRVLIENLKSPHGLDFFQDPQTKTTWIYIAETNQVARYPYDINSGKLVKTTGQNIAFLPDGGRHFTRTIAFGPNFRTAPIIKGTNEKETLSATKLYISVGSSCDACVEDTWKRGAILESDPEGTYTAEFAGGLRNSVFFTFHPETKEIWATEMGRDNLGDNLPPDEINIIRVGGADDKSGAKRYGWPFCYGNRVKDKTFKPVKVDRIDIPENCSQTEAPVIEIPAHSAPLGLAFIPPVGGWPNQWQGSLLVAYHGSWNRRVPTGYKIVRFAVDKKGKVSEVEDFITGWLVPNKAEGLNKDGKIFGRPVDLKFSTDGSLYITDDASGLIYRISPK